MLVVSHAQARYLSKCMAPFYLLLKQRYKTKAGILLSFGLGSEMDWSSRLLGLTHSRM